MTKSIEMPYQILKGNNLLRYFAAILLFGIILISAYAIQFVGYVMILIILLALFGIIIIRYPKIYVFEEHFIIEKKCIIKKLSDREIFKFEEIKNVEYIKGNINWPQLILQTILGQGGVGGFSKPDQMKIKFQNDTFRIYYRFGTRQKFFETVNIISRKVSPATNSG